MGRDVSLSDACGDHAQPVYDRLSAHGRDPATARVQQLYDHPERGGFREPARPGYRAVPRHRQLDGARSRQTVSTRVGHRVQLLWQPPGALRAFLRQRPADTGARPERDLPEARGHGTRVGIPRPQRRQVVTEACDHFEAVRQKQLDFETIAVTIGRDKHDAVTVRGCANQFWWRWTHNVVPVESENR